MSLPKESSSGETLVVQNVAQVSTLNNETEIKVQLCKISGTVIEIQSSEASPDRCEAERIPDHTNNANELNEHLEHVGSSIINDENNLNDVELNVDQSPVKKNRRKRKKKKDSDDAGKDSIEVHNSQSSKTGPKSEDVFSVQHLNEVFSVWGITKPKEGEKCQDSVHATCSSKYKQEDHCREETNSAGTSGQISSVSDVNIQQREHVVESATAVKLQQRCESQCPVGAGKSKSAEKRRTMKKLEENAEIGSQQIGKAEMSKLDSCIRDTTTMGEAGCAVEACGRSAKTKGKKKLAMEKSMKQPNESASCDFVKSLDELYQLLKPRTTNNLRECSQSPNEQGKILKKTMNKQEEVPESQSKNKKKKEKLKLKREISTSTAERDAGDNTEALTPNQKSPEKKQKKKNKQFEEHWTLEAVMEGIQNGTVIEGPIRINPRRYTEAYVTSPTGAQDILIEGIFDRNRALEGDLVAIQLKDPSEWKTKNHGQEKGKCKENADTSELIEEEEGEMVADLNGIECDSSQKPQVTAKVVAILSKQHSRKCVGYLKVMKKPNDKNAQFSPRDARIPRMQIPQYKCPKDFWLNPAAKEKTLYMAKMVKWTAGSFALGEIVKEIGQTADVQAETEALLLDNDLDVTPYPEEIYKQYSTSLFNVSEEELKKREDLREECIFTIDPRTAKDLDDAVSCKELENGNFQIGVHISDVSYFLEEGSVLDIEVSKRATSVYLVDRVN